jgi:hypothetical protein
MRSTIPNSPAAQHVPSGFPARKLQRIQQTALGRLATAGGTQTMTPADISPQRPFLEPLGAILATCAAHHKRVAILHLTRAVHVDGTVCHEALKRKGVQGPS